MLNQLPGVVAPHPPHILNTFFPLLEQYGELKVDETFEALVYDIADWVNMNPVPWEHYIDAERLLKLKTENSLVEVFRLVYESLATANNAHTWVCKSMQNVNFVYEMEQNGLRPFYLHLYRDGRDVALSFKKAIVGPKHIYHLAKKWDREQKQALALKGKLGEERVISIAYEKLIASPEQVLKEICFKTGLSFSTSALEYFKSVESEKTAHSGEMWANVTKPVMQKNYNKYKTELSDFEIAVFEKVAGTSLKRLGYQCETIPSAMSDFTRTQLKQFDVENQTLIRKTMANAKKADLQKRENQKNMLENLKNKLLRA